MMRFREAAIRAGAALILGGVIAAATADPPLPRADAARLEQSIQALSQYGANPQGGVSRLAFGPADIAARAYVRELMREAGLEVRVDAAGNLIGRRAGTETQLPAIAFGSHIDSVPQGGNYDGDVGVLGAIGAALLLAENGIALKHPIEASSSRTRKAAPSAARRWQEA